MTAYSIIPYPALPTAYTEMKPGRRIDMIVIHATAGTKAGDLFTLSGRDRRHLVSTHLYVTKQPEIYQLVQDKDLAWHAGTSFWQGESDCNRFSLGIELENLNNGTDKYPQAQLDALVWLTRQKVAQYHIPRDRVVRHAEIALPPGRKTDPRNFPWQWFLNEVSMTQPAPAPEPAPERSYTRTYRVRQDATATIRTAWWREDNVVASLPAGTEFEADLIHFGEVVGDDDQWVHLADGRGFVHMSAVERVL